MRWFTLFLLAMLTGLAPGTLSAQAGVGVNVGKIQVDEDLAPGGTYHLPSVGVINTGHDASDYSVSISYLADQEQLPPPEDWFSFSPAVFPLEPGETQTVAIRLDIPITARAGDYFALVQASPVVAESPGVVIGVAAATKLSFTVRPSNPFLGSALWAYYRVSDAAPYSYITAGLLVLLVLGYFGRRRFRIQIRVERRD